MADEMFLRSKDTGHFARGELIPLSKPLRFYLWEEATSGDLQTRGPGELETALKP